MTATPPSTRAALLKPNGLLLVALVAVVRSGQEWKSPVIEEVIWVRNLLGVVIATLVLLPGTPARAARQGRAADQLNLAYGSAMAVLSSPCDHRPLLPR